MKTQHWVFAQNTSITNTNQRLDASFNSKATDLALVLSEDRRELLELGKAFVVLSGGLHPLPRTHGTAFGNVDDLVVVLDLQQLLAQSSFAFTIEVDVDITTEETSRIRISILVEDVPQLEVVAAKRVAVICGHRRHGHAHQAVRLDGGGHIVLIRSEDLDLGVNGTNVLIHGFSPVRDIRLHTVDDGPDVGENLARHSFDCGKEHGRVDLHDVGGQDLQ